MPQRNLSFSRKTKSTLKNVGEETFSNEASGSLPPRSVSIGLNGVPPRRNGRWVWVYLRGSINFRVVRYSLTDLFTGHIEYRTE